MIREQRPTTADKRGRCSRTMATPTPDFIAWLEAVERFAVRVDDAPLALCALSAKHNRGVLGHLAALLRELSRFAGERAGDVIAIGTPLARCQYERAIECSKLTAQGWDFLALEAERRRGAHT